MREKDVVCNLQLLVGCLMKVEVATKGEGGRGREREGEGWLKWLPPASSAFLGYLNREKTCTERPHQTLHGTLSFKWAVNTCDSLFCQQNPSF